MISPRRSPRLPGKRGDVGWVDLNRAFKVIQRRSEIAPQIGYIGALIVPFGVIGTILDQSIIGLFGRIKIIGCVGRKTAIQKLLRMGIWRRFP